MLRFKRKCILVLLAFAGLAAAQPMPLVDPEVRRIGEQLRCMCGSCNYTVTSCNMMSCSGAEYGRKKLYDLVQKGLTEEQIKAEFVKEFGIVVLTAPPAEGFNLVGWVMPFVALAFGLLVVWWLLKTFLRKPAHAEMDDAVLEQYKDRIEKDLQKID